MRLYISFLIAVLFSVNHCLAENIDNQYSLAVGAARKATYFIVSDPDEGYDKGELHGTDSDPYALFRSPYHYFNPKYGIGWYWEVGYSRFFVNQQSSGVYGQYYIPGGDYGTSVRGEYIYATPVLHYNFTGQNNADKSNLLGIGIGPAYLRASGTIKVTDEIGFLRDQTIDLDNVGYAINFLWNYRIERFMIRIKAGNVIVKKGNNEYEVEDYELSFSFLI